MQPTILLLPNVSNIIIAVAVKNYMLHLCVQPKLAYKNKLKTGNFVRKGFYLKYDDIERVIIFF